MANLRDVRLRMRAIEQTLQVTKAMNLISTSKLRKGRRVLDQAVPFFNRVQKTMSDLLRGVGRVQSRYFEQREGSRTAIIVITSDKGLAGGYNTNVIRHVLKLCETVEKPVLIPVGSAGLRYFSSSPYLVLENFSFASALPTLDDAGQIADYVIAQFDWGVFREVRVVYTHMYSALKLVLTEREVLPFDYEVMREVSHKALEGGNVKSKDPTEIFDYIPSAEKVFDHLAPMYIKGVIYGCLVESYASEQSARMSAMDEASKNGNEMLAAQRVYYNRVRQSGITQEVSEIVSGAAAL
jgi:F-type H+-transporting ATPase subunit gamma